MYHMTKSIPNRTISYFVPNCNYPYLIISAFHLTDAPLTFFTWRCDFVPGVCFCFLAHPKFYCSQHHYAAKNIVLGANLHV